MDEMAKAAYIISQASALMATVMGMHAENMQREALGHSMAYDHQAFENAVLDAGMSHNQVLTYLKGI